MSRKLLTIAVAVAMGLAFVVPASAAVQSVRVGGDLVIRGIYRDNIDFFKQSDGGSGSDAWLSSMTRVWVGAELTDNVSVMIRLLNEQDWGTRPLVVLDGEVNKLLGNNDVEIDLAYVVIGDILMPGLTATLGRQEILLGKGFVVGNRNAGGFGLPLVGQLRAREYSARKSFDAWRLDYEAGVMPLDLTLFGAKINESYDKGLVDVALGIQLGRMDRDLLGLNVAYHMDNAVVEGYLLNLKAQMASGIDDYQIWTLGARLDHEWISVPGLAWSVEAAYQFGDGLDVDADGDGDDKEAWAGTIDLNYTMANPYQPVIGVGYSHFTGQGTSDKDTAWDPIYPDDIASRVGSVLYGAAANVFLANQTNLSALKIYGSFSPMDRHELCLAWFPEVSFNETPVGISGVLGWGADLGYTYQYTEDLSLGLLLGYFDAGKGLRDNVGIPDANFDKVAWQAIATVAVSF